MFKIPKQEYTAEFKELAVKRVKAGRLERPARGATSPDMLSGVVDDAFPPESNHA